MSTQRQTTPDDVPQRGEIEDVVVDVDLANGSATLTTRRSRTLFDDDGRFVMYSDEYGWNGLVIEDGVYHKVNVQTRGLDEYADPDEYPRRLTDKVVSREQAEEIVRTHVEEQGLQRHVSPP